MWIISWLINYVYWPAESKPCTALLFYTHYINGHSNKVYTTTITNAIGQTILCNTLTYSNPEVLIRTNSLDFFSHLGPLHVLWQVSFGCWVTWSISSWQKYHKSFFFPKDDWWVAELLFLSLNNWGLNFLQNPLKFTFHQKNGEKCLLFILANFWMIRSNCQLPNSFFGIAVNFIIQELKFCQLLSFWL